MRSERLRPVSESEKSFKSSVLFLGAHCALALAAVLVAPADGNSVPRFLRSWGEMLEVVVPSIQHIPVLTQFSAQAWFASVVMWTLLPLSAVIAARLRGLWIPNETRLRRQPWLLLFAAAIFGFVAVGMMRYSPVDTSGYGFGARNLAAMTGGRISYGIYLGLIVCGVGLSIGFLARLLPIARRVMHDDFKDMRA